MYKQKPGVTRILQAMLYQNVEKNEWVLLFDYMYVVICTPFYHCVTTGPLQQQQQKQQQRQRLVKIYLNKIME